MFKYIIPNISEKARLFLKLKHYIFVMFSLPFVSYFINLSVFNAKYRFLLVFFNISTKTAASCQKQTPVRFCSNAVATNRFAVRHRYYSVPRFALQPLLRAFLRGVEFSQQPSYSMNTPKIGEDISLSSCNTNLANAKHNRDGKTVARY